VTGRRAKLYGKGANVRDWIHVDDDAVRRILDDGQSGCGAEGERDNLSVLRTLLALMGRDPDDFDQSSTEPATTFGMPSTLFC
jgi:dTDP-glucose 4,6-dehydratase